ncbi:pyroglutamyl-peptidase I [Promicromonospora thailandica]|uniref:Pyrrolidone-carboxylate peptidase n=1 Tax=Promicromonospora thailandica TaxID=765201 RepID=A0A9X2JWN4_9MICO|nr:pyroglutamyl-peptidase I [Promicromonospora thailandica]MCP2266790.1 pyroglutamyl-peptidase [Promicromonospora thailandica]BFF21958.1 pyroglutamyl-peptidase I [Promicromonospora thailandica]
MKVLVTGFEPFGGDTVNASADAVAALAERWSGPDELVTAVLPVEFDEVRGPHGRLMRLLDEHAPDVVVATGLADGVTQVRVERVAINLMDARIPDNGGARPVDAPVADGGPDARFATLPVKAAAAAVREAGIPAGVTYSAGTYVCNATFYALQHALAERPGVLSGFVHVPRSTEEVGAQASESALADGGAAHLPLDALAHALEIVVRTALRAARGDVVEPDAPAGALH